MFTMTPNLMHPNLRFSFFMWGFGGSRGGQPRWWFGEPRGGAGGGFFERRKLAGGRTGIKEAEGGGGIW